MGGLYRMLNSSKHKAGVTLMELMAVIAIMGILSGMGIAGLRSAVANARTKDAAFNVTAYLERAANEARRLNATLCVKRDGDQKLVTYKSECSANPLGAKVDELELESPVKIIDSQVKDGSFKDAEGKFLTNWYSGGAAFTPRPGLSAAPYSGYYAVQYAGRALYGAALKTKSKNSFTPMMGSDAGWSGI